MPKVVAPEFDTISERRAFERSSYKRQLYADKDPKQLRSTHVLTEFMDNRKADQKWKTEKHLYLPHEGKGYERRKVYKN